MSTTTARSAAKRAPSAGRAADGGAPAFRTREECLVAGKALRATVPRERHAGWKRPPTGAIRSTSSRRRIAAGCPSWSRSATAACCAARSPSCAAPPALMAADLADAPRRRASGCRPAATATCSTSACSPRPSATWSSTSTTSTRRCPRRGSGTSSAWRSASSWPRATTATPTRQARAAAVECVRAYREHLRECSKMSPLDVWYERLDVADASSSMAPDAEIEEGPEGSSPSRRASASASTCSRRSAGEVGGAAAPRRPAAGALPRRRTKERRVGRPRGDGGLSTSPCPTSAACCSTATAWRTSRSRSSASAASARAASSGSSSPRRTIRCSCSSRRRCRSVLEPYAGKSVYENQGQRVVAGQRLMQSASDIFLGWTHGRREAAISTCASCAT